jgi:hypothetical protein
VEIGNINFSRIKILIEQNQNERPREKRNFGAETLDGYVFGTKYQITKQTKFYFQSFNL